MAPQPSAPAELIFAFNRLALQGFGGVLAVAQVELVERRRWMSREQFVELLAVAQVLPGPNIVNLALMFGDRCFGWRGAVAALRGLTLVPLAIVMVMTLVYGRFSALPAVAGALRGTGCVAAGLVIATVVKLAATLRGKRLGAPLCIAVAAVTFAAIAWARLPLVWVIVAVGSIAMALAAWRFSR